MMHQWWLRFPALATLSDPAWSSLCAAAKVMTIPAGSVLFRAGDACANYVLVLNGSIRVQKLGENGREITLYRVESGESCVLTTACLMAGEQYAAEGVAETDALVVVIPVAVFQQTLDDSPGFRRFVFAAFGQRVTDLIVLVEAIAFGRIDERLTQRLLDLAGAGSVIETTHQALAAELGTAREVVSRQLKEFERQGMVHLQRGRIEILQRDALPLQASKTTSST